MCVSRSKRKPNASASPKPVRSANNIAQAETRPVPLVDPSKQYHGIGNVNSFGLTLISLSCHSFPQAGRFSRDSERHKTAQRSLPAGFGLAAGPGIFLFDPDHSNQINRTSDTSLLGARPGLIDLFR